MTESREWLDEIVRRNATMNTIILILSGIALLIFFILMGMMYMDHRKMKRVQKRPFPTESGYRPVVTDTVQIVNGVEFHRMGVCDRTID